MKITTNYGLKKPDGTDSIDIGIINQNMDTVDSKLKNNAEQITDCLGEIEKVKQDIGNIDVSWDGVTGKPTQFPPSQHGHNDATTSTSGYMSATDKTKLNGVAQGANAYVHPGSGTNPHGTTKTDVGLGSVQNYGVATQAQVDAASANNVYVTPLGLAGLKQSVVNGKQEVVNAIDGKLGYNSGLTATHPHVDYAWWIRNRIVSTSSLVLEPHSGTRVNISFPQGRKLGRTSDGGTFNTTSYMTIVQDGTTFNFTATGTIMVWSTYENQWLTWTNPNNQVLNIPSTSWLVILNPSKVNITIKTAYGRDFYSVIN